MASPRAIARALARGAEKEAVKPRAPKPLTAEEIAAARHVFRAGDDAGLGRNYVRGVMKFTADGMTPEARLARSREMGIDTETPLYHGTPADEFAGFQGTTYLSPSPSTASRFGYDGRVIPARVRLNNPAYETRDQMRVESLRSFPERAAELRAAGNDALIWSGEEGKLVPVQQLGGPSTPQVAALDPSNIRSPFATFDPARANRRDLLAGVVPVAAAGGAGALAMQPGEAQAQTLQPPQPSALARALAREAPRFNAALDTSLDVASFFDPTGGYATETARALKDLPAKVGPAGAVALAPLTGATEALGSIGQLPELGVAGGRAIARAIARKPAPRGSGTYRKAQK